MSSPHQGKSHILRLKITEVWEIENGNLAWTLHVNAIMLVVS